MPAGVWRREPPRYDRAPAVPPARPMTRMYVRVVIVEAAVIAALWLFGRAFH
jgi:hypothetical protein